MQKDEHDWQQGITAIESLIDYFSNTGDLICDPFLGSGTTAIACKAHNRRFIGCEIDGNTFNLAKSKIYND
jgi:DNA modification methylase